MDITQILNNIVLGLSRLGDFVNGWVAAIQSYEIITELFPAWGSAAVEKAVTPRV